MDSPLLSRISEYLDFLRYEQNASVHTLRNYESDLRQFYAYLTRTPAGDPRPEPELGQVDNITIRDFLASLYAHGNTRASVARKLAAYLLAVDRSGQPFQLRAFIPATG